MKNTGIVRRIDDLGRIVIPKEIRRTQHISEGDPMEIYLGNDGEIIFKQYSPLGELRKQADTAARILKRVTNQPVIICDSNGVIIAHYGLNCGNCFTVQNVECLIRGRESYEIGIEGDDIYPVEGYEFPARVIVPITSAGDVYGAIIVMKNISIEEKCGVALLHYVKAFAEFLGTMMGEV